jgi:hypothetical protein
VEQVLQTFYQWPLMLPSNLVYFGRAAVLVEGIGLRYDPNFNALAVARPVLARSAARLLQGAADDSRARLTDWTQEAMAAVRTVRDLVRRVERDELRVRSHPRDILELQRFLAQQVRRALLALFAFTIALISSVVYLATRRLTILVLGVLLAFAMFVVVFLLPTHLFQNPLRFRRKWPDRRPPSTRLPRCSFPSSSPLFGVTTGRSSPRTSPPGSSSALWRCRSPSPSPSRAD